MAMTIQHVRLERIKRPLKRPFITSLQEVTERESIIVTVQDSEGRSGYGECVAFSTPWYTEETITSCQFVLEHVLIPLVEGKQLNEPRQVADWFGAVKGNRMAKAALESAIWDLAAKCAGKSLAEFVGGTKDTVAAGTVVAVAHTEAAAVDEAANAGYRRIKVKIRPSDEMNVFKQIISTYPEVLFFADANGAFEHEPFERLLEWDEAGFYLIEQPFSEESWELHRRASAQMQTKICLDESLRSFEDAKRMVREAAGTVAVLKMGRLGGWAETLRIVDYLKAHGVQMWVGGMIEFGVSKAHNLALASIAGVDLPGDLTASNHYWEADIIEPEISVRGGEVTVSNTLGIGYNVVLEEEDEQCS
ncbi:o-succinylbenzoate synthase [Planomicrobium sp. YIM 101495]|uniref:o-succinylbenzoate synthase n=1 Tax=Planomicrobium sp. YIM 101495 TaxID=2665160 RepID=UPI0012B748C4|nr:o-succinylbenzoate synthase [Planomicrobium sp. YIM 101495]MTD29447.1 o-succinylbenzoate synthase [Planomicrobium sp. YIM 101495]